MQKYVSLLWEKAVTKRFCPEYCGVYKAVDFRHVLRDTGDPLIDLRRFYTLCLRKPQHNCPQQ